VQCPADGEAGAATAVGFVVILLVVVCCLMAKGKQNQGGSAAVAVAVGENPFSKFQEPTQFPAPPGIFNCYKCSQPTQYVGRENETTSSEATSLFLHRRFAPRRSLSVLLSF